MLILFTTSLRRSTREVLLSVGSIHMTINHNAPTSVIRAELATCIYDRFGMKTAMCIADNNAKLAHCTAAELAEATAEEP